MLTHQSGQIAKRLELVHVATYGLRQSVDVLCRRLQGIKRCAVGQFEHDSLRGVVGPGSLRQRITCRAEELPGILLKTLSSFMV